MPDKGGSETDWGPWSASDDHAYSRLARYANANEVDLRELRLWVEDSYSEASKDPLGLLGKLYDTLRAKELPFERESWQADARQLIRDARGVDLGGGTCLDFSLIFAAMCKHAGLRAHVALLREQPSDTREDHALVLVDLNAGVGRGGAEPRVDCVEFRDADAVRERHVYRRMPSGARLGRGAVAVDVVGACRRQGLDFASACEQGEELLVGSPGYVDCVLVDIVGLQADGHPAFGPMTADQRPTIHRRLPPRPDFVLYESRRRLVGQLAGAVGTVVLFGAQGSGKSMLAHHIAAVAQHGAGWFLDAGDPGALSTSLGDQELKESGIDPDVVDKTARDHYARRALARLRDARGSWVVVLDNVDVSPEHLTGQPVPAADKGQLLLVTTTNPEWLRRAGVRSVELEPLPAEEVAAQLGADAPTDLLGGLPLLTHASQRFHQATGRHWWTNAGELPRSDVPDAFWAAVRAELEGAGGGVPGGTSVARDSVALHLAACLSWLPPTDLALDPVAEMVSATAVAAGEPRVTREQVAAAATRLQRLGLIDARERRVTMHRLFRGAIREELGRRSPDGGARLVGAMTERLFASVDSVGEQILLAAGGPAREPGAGAFHEVVLQRDDVSTMADLLRRHGDVRGLHALGGLVERHVSGAGRIYGDVETLIDASWPGAPAERPPWIRLILVNCLRGHAREVFRSLSSSADRKKWALAQMERCRELCADEPSEPALRAAFRLVAARAEAMHGLLLRNSVDPADPPSRRLELFRQAQPILEESARRRVELVGGQDSPDLDRSQFNLAGLAIAMSQVDDEEKRAVHLDRAWELYDAVLRIRERRYRTRHLEECAACVNGLAYVAYYRALLLPGSVQQHAGYLREAAQYATEAAELRQHLDGGIDGENTAKSVEIGLKIALARIDLLAAVNNRPRSRVDLVVAAYCRETGQPPLTRELPTAEPLDRSGAAATVSPPTGSRTFTMEPTFSPVPLVASAADPLPGIEEWITSDAMRALVTAFDGDEKSLFGNRRDLVERVQRLYAFSKRWETRPGGQERSGSVELEMTTAQRDIVLAATAALGLHHSPRPRYDSYDHVLLLGGLIRACFNRPAFTAQLVGDGSIRTSSVVALGGHRLFGPANNPEEDELKLRERIGYPELAEEYEALDLGTRLAFGLGEPEHVEGEEHTTVGGTWGVRHYTHPTVRSVRVAAAPSSDPEIRRAHTGDTYAFFAEHMERLRPGARLLLVTTPIYRPSQHFTALHRLALPYRVHVETVGGDPAGMHDALRQRFTPSKYVGEVRTALRELCGLAEAAVRIEEEG